MGYSRRSSKIAADSDDAFVPLLEATSQKEAIEKEFSRRINTSVPLFFSEPINQTEDSLVSSRLEHPHYDDEDKMGARNSIDGLN